MAYSDFKTLSQVREAFGLEINETRHLFETIVPIVPSDYLQRTLEEYLPLVSAINTEKARSELIIAPVLLEVRRQLDFQVSFFSGTDFSVEPEAGLNGYCDYILAASAELYEIRQPVVMLVEAKNENIKGGLGQCIAEMLAAQKFNLKSDVQSDIQIETIYGAVTTGTVWKFLQLRGKQVAIDLSEYYIKEIEHILGILVEPFKPYLVGAGVARKD